MSASIFNNKTQPPVLADLERVLGDAHRWFEQIVAHIERGGTIIYDWKYYGQKSGPD